MGRDEPVVAGAMPRPKSHDALQRDQLSGHGLLPQHRNIGPGPLRKRGIGWRLPLLFRSYPIHRVHSLGLSAAKSGRNRITAKAYQPIAEFVIAAMQVTQVFSVRLAILILATPVFLLFILNLTFVILPFFMLFVLVVTVTASTFKKYL